MSAADVIDAEVVPETDLVPATPGTLFRTDDPVMVLERATETANALKKVLQDQKLTSNIQGREHVRVEGWQTLGAMLGVTPVCVWTRPIEKGWEARVEARTLDGRVIGAAEAMCSREERTWKGRDDYALRSMAQTRATSKALGSPLRFVVTLAGYDGTPAEEMDFHPPQPEPEPEPYEKPENAISAERVNELGKAIGAKTLSYADIDQCLTIAGARRLSNLNGQGLRNRLETLTPKQADAFAKAIAVEPAE